MVLKVDSLSATTRRFQHTLSLAKTHKRTEAELKWLSQAALEPWKRNNTKLNHHLFNVIFQPRLLDTKELVNLFFFFFAFILDKGVKKKCRLCVVGAFIPSAFV